LPTRHHFAFFKDADIKYNSAEFKINNNNYNIKKHVFPTCADVSIEPLRKKGNKAHISVYQLCSLQNQCPEQRQQHIQWVLFDQKHSTCTNQS